MTRRWIRTQKNRSPSFRRARFTLRLKTLLAEHDVLEGEAGAVRGERADEGHGVVARRFRELR